MTTTVLVVDDDQNMQTLCRATLTRAGYQVESAMDGAAALRLLVTLRPSVILMDWLMPHSTGMAALGEIKADPALAAIPVVFLTAKAIPEDRALALASGAAGYLVKPCRASVLLAEIARVLHG